MKDETYVDELLSRWQNVQARGVELTVAELCQDCPELLPEVERRVRALRQLQQLAVTADGTGTSQEAADRDAPGAFVPRTLGGYELLSELGRGGMGVVYKAQQVALKRPVALKMILSGGHAGTVQRQRFHAEAEVVARVKHPHIVEIYDIGELDGQPYFALEYVAGGSLAQQLNGTPLPPAPAAAMLETLARAMHHAHTHGVVHRDLKPANVLLTTDGQPKVTDFGVAKQADSQLQTATGALIGTPPYMAPEQAEGKHSELGPACDIYALGAILYECLTGRPPFRAATVVETLQQVMRAEPVPPRQLNAQVPRDLETICLKCLRKEPAKRYSTALDLAEDLQRFARNVPIHARPTGQVERAWRWCRRNVALATSLAAVALVLMIASVVSLLFALQAEDARQAEAEHARNEGLAKQQAEALAKREEAARLDADKARAAAQRQLIDICGASGAAAARQGDHPLALLWFARAVQLATHEPELEELNRIRVGNWLRQVCLPEGMFTVPGMRPNQQRYRQLQFSPDGNYLVVVASNATCLVWDRRNGQLVTLPDEAARGTAAAWQPGTGHLAVAERTGTIRLLAAPTFQPVEQFQGPAMGTVLAFSRDGARLAWGGFGGARVWDTKRRQYFTPVLQHGAVVRAAAFNATGEMLATASGDNLAQVFRVDASDGLPLFPPVPHIGGDEEYRHGGPDAVTPRFAAGDEALLTVEEVRPFVRLLRFRSPITGQVLPSFPALSEPECSTFAVSEHGERIAMLGVVKGRLLDAQRRRPLALIAGLERGCNEHVALSTDGRTLALVGADTRARFFAADDLAGDALRETHPAIYHPAVPVRVSLTANQRHMATALWDGTVCVWRLPAGVPTAYTAGAGGMTVTAVTPDRRFILPRGTSYKLGQRVQTRVHAADTGAAAGPPLDVGGILLDAAFSPDGSRVVTASSNAQTVNERERAPRRGDKGGTVQLWDWRTGKALATPLHLPHEPRGLTYRPDGQLLVVVCADYQVLLVDPRTLTIMRTLKPGVRAPNTEANQYFTNGEARFSIDARYLITWEMTQQVHIWDAQQGKLLHVLPHGERIKHVAMTPTNPDLLATCGWVGEARIWSLSTGKLLATLKHPQWVQRLRFSPDGQQLITSADDGVLRTWDWQNSRLIDGWPLHAIQLLDYDFTADRRWLVSMAEHELQVTDWRTRTPATPSWDIKPVRSLLLELVADEQRAVVNGFAGALVGYDLKSMRTPVTGDAESLVDLAELTAGRRISEQGNIVPLTSADWAERWRRVLDRQPALVRTALDGDHADTRAWHKLGLELNGQRDPALAIDAYRHAVAADPANAPAWYDLAVALYFRRDKTESIAAHRKLLALDPGHADGWFSLGNALREHGDRAGACAAFRKAVELAPNYAEAHCNLGLVLKTDGVFVAALAALEKGHALGSRRPHWRYPSADWVSHCRQLLDLDKQLPAVLAGKSADRSVLLALANLCRVFKHRYLDAAQLYTRAFAEKQPAEPDSRYQAASAAVLAAARQGIGAEKLPSEEQSRLRQQAVAWLTEDLDVRRKLLAANPLAAAVLAGIENWQQAAELATVRDTKLLAELPERERESWRALWTKVNTLRKEYRAAFKEVQHQGTIGPGHPEQVFPLTLSADQTYVIDQESGDLDSYLRLEEVGGKALAENDDIAPGNLNARIVFRPVRDATYRVVATSFEQRGSGKFTLRIRTVPRVKAPADPPKSTVQPT